MICNELDGVGSNGTWRSELLLLAPFVIEFRVVVLEIASQQTLHISR